jgi:ribosomal-protein-alanine N-acetyltransferase
MDFGFKKHRLSKIWGISIINNIGTIFNLKKLGFIQEGRLRGHAKRKGKQVDRIIFGILKKEWSDKRKKFYY